MIYLVSISTLINSPLAMSIAAQLLNAQWRLANAKPGPITEWKRTNIIKKFRGKDADIFVYREIRKQRDVIYEQRIETCKMHSRALKQECALKQEYTKLKKEQTDLDKARARIAQKQAAVVEKQVALVSAKAALDQDKAAHRVAQTALTYARSAFRQRRAAFIESQAKHRQELAEHEIACDSFGQSRPSPNVDTRLLELERGEYNLAKKEKELAANRADLVKQRQEFDGILAWQLRHQQQFKLDQNRFYEEVRAHNQNLQRAVNKREDAHANNLFAISDVASEYKKEASRPVI